MTLILALTVVWSVIAICVSLWNLHRLSQIHQELSVMDKAVDVMLRKAREHMR